MSDKNEIIRSAAAQVAENYRKSDILMYGDALRLPSRTAVIEIIRDFQKILFPAYYGDRDLLKLPPEQYSALLMGHVYDKLLRQLELVMPEGEEGARRAEKVCEAMMERLPHIQELLLKDLTANYNGDPAASSRQEIILSYPGMFAIFIYRIAHELYLEKVPMIPRIMTEYAHSQTGIDINPGATIGEYFSIDHGTGVVVGETTVIGDRVQLAQAFFYTGERLKRRLQGLDAAVAGIVPLLQFAQGQAACLLQLPLQAGRRKLVGGIDPGGNILAAGNLDAAVFQPVKHQPHALKPGDAPGDGVQVDLVPGCRDKLRVIIQRKHADELGAHDGRMLDAHCVHHAAVGVHTDQKFTFFGKIRQCVCHKTVPLYVLFPIKTP